MIRVEDEGQRRLSCNALSSLVYSGLGRAPTDSEMRRFDDHLEAIVRYDMRMAATGDALAMRTVRMYRDENARYGGGPDGPYPWVDDTDNDDRPPPTARSDPRDAGIDAMRARAQGLPGW